MWALTNCFDSLCKQGPGPGMSRLTPANHAELEEQGWTVVPAVYPPALCAKLRDLMCAVPHPLLQNPQKKSLCTYNEQQRAAPLTCCCGAQGRHPRAGRGGRPHLVAAGRARS